MVHFFRRPATGAELNDSQQTGLTICNSICLAVPVIAVAGRFWARIIKSELRLWWDDWILLIALIVNTAQLGMFYREIDLGYGRHTDAIPLSNLLEILKINYASGITYNVTSWAYKTAAVFLYLRVFGANRKFSIAALALVGVMIVYHVVVIIIYATQCSPRAKAWDPLLKGKCYNQVTFYVVTQACSAVWDIAVLLLPLPMIAALRLPVAQKLWLVAVFSLGYAVTAIPIVRLGFFAHDAWILGNEDIDITWNGVLLLYMILPEASVAIVGLCSPPIFQLLQRVRRHGLSSLFRGSDTTKASRASYEMAPAKRQTSSRASTTPNRNLVGQTSLEDMEVNGAAQAGHSDGEGQKPAASYVV